MNDSTTTRCPQENSLVQVATKSAFALSRRSFVKAAAGATLLTGVSPETLMAETREGMPQRALGRTGEKVSAIGLGGYHVGKQGDENESITIIRKAIDGGITFMDNCWDYNARSQ